VSTAREIYRVTIHPGASAAGPTKLATMIINRWMPNNAGGAPFLLAPKLAKSLEQFFARAKSSGKSVNIQISTMSLVPEITEIL
jgi:hypothetical protein